ncbi:HigA family addiction module antidote protein [Escherichia coli]
MRMFNPPHPGLSVKESLDVLQISMTAYARLIDVSPSTIFRLTKGKTAITAPIARKLAATIGSTPDQWLRLQAGYDVWKDEQEHNLGHLKRLFVSSVE